MMRTRWPFLLRGFCGLFPSRIAYIGNVDATSGESAPLIHGSRSHRGFRWAFWFLALVLVLYPLSSGPAAKLDSVGVLPPRIYPIVYGPLIRVASAAGLTRILDWYIWDLWNVRGSYIELSTPPPLDAPVPMQ